MKELETMKRLDQFDYEILGVKDNWYIGSTTNMLTSFEMDVKGYFMQEDKAYILDKIYNKYWTYITGVMLKGLLPYVTHHEPGDFMMYQDDNVDVDKCIREFNTSFGKEAFLKCVEIYNKVNIDVAKLNKYLAGELIPETVTLPEISPPRIVFEKVIKVLKGDNNLADEITVQNKSEDNKIEMYGCSHIADGDMADSKYPEFKGIKRNELTDEQFTKLKQYYGIARDAETKWRKAVAIAAKIGILFYERGLDKPTNRPAFIAAYKKEFDSVIKNDSVAKAIYENLPEKYQGSSGAPTNNSGISADIKAAVFAGFMEGTQGDVNGIELRSALQDEGYQIPDENVMQIILEAMSKLKN